MDKYPMHRAGATGYNGTGKIKQYVGCGVFPPPRSKGKGDEREMKEIEMIKNEIEQRENSIKEMEEKLKEAKKELKKFEKYRGLKFDLYSNYGGGIYYKGLARDCFRDILRKLALCIVGTKNKKGVNIHV